MDFKSFIACHTHKHACTDTHTQIAHAYTHHMQRETHMPPPHPSPNAKTQFIKYHLKYCVFDQACYTTF